MELKQVEAYRGCVPHRRRGAVCACVLAPTAARCACACASRRGARVSIAGRRASPHTSARHARSPAVLLVSRPSPPAVRRLARLHPRARRPSSPHPTRHPVPRHHGSLRLAPAQWPLRQEGDACVSCLCRPRASTPHPPAGASHRPPSRASARQHSPRRCSRTPVVPSQRTAVRCSAAPGRVPGLPRAPAAAALGTADTLCETQLHAMGDAVTQRQRPAARCTAVATCRAASVPARWRTGPGRASWRALCCMRLCLATTPLTRALARQQAFLWSDSTQPERPVRSAVGAAGDRSCADARVPSYSHSLQAQARRDRDHDPDYRCVLSLHSWLFARCTRQLRMALGPLAASPASATGRRAPLFRGRAPADKRSKTCHL
jgi:hypothetical protein